MSAANAPAGIVVLGDVGLDVVTRHDGVIAYGSDTRATVRFTGGGAGANTALWLRSSGIDTTLIARIGDDPGGRLIQAELESAGVRCVFTVDDEAATCCVVVLVDADSQRSMLSDRGANARLRPTDIARDAFSGARHLHLSGYVLLDQASRAAGLASLAIAKEAGLTTSVDPQAASLITDPAAFLDDVRGVDLLLPNTEELAALTGSTQPATAQGLLDTVGAVVVTAGLNGASWVDADGIETVSADLTECVDSTGAGDAFNAGILAGWLAGKSTGDTLRGGVRLGALAVSQVGAQPR